MSNGKRIVGDLYLMPGTTVGKDYDVALSFAGEERVYVEQVAESLRSKGVAVFYDQFEEADLWGKNLYDHFMDVYQNQARYAILFISSHYKEKVWANHERQSAQSRALEQSIEYVLPARFDDTELAGILSTVGYVDLRSRTPEEFGVIICKKLGKSPFDIKAHEVPSPKSASEKGEVTFDYSSYNGKYRIGKGTFEFETRWSKASNTSIHCYTDSPSVRGVAALPHGSSLKDVTDASELDMTSRVRDVVEGGFAVLQNHNGFYVGLQILDIKDDTRLPDDRDELTFRYWILRDGSRDFSVLDRDYSPAD